MIGASVNVPPMEASLRAGERAHRKDCDRASGRDSTYIVLGGIRAALRRSQGRHGGQCWYTARVGGEAAWEVDSGIMGGLRLREARAVARR